MRKYYFYRKIVPVSIFLILVISRVMGVYGGLDDWTMFRHDQRNTGESKSTAPESSKVLWTYKTGAGVSSSPAVANGRVYIGSLDFQIYCLEALSGSKIWNYTTGNVVHSSPAVDDGMVYVGSTDNQVYARRLI
jgi:outer membrane protein assembly factor BamB